MKVSLFKFLRFGIVGTSGFLIDFATTWLMLSVFGIFEYAANTVGFTLAATSNYFLNRRWTWRSNNPNVKGEFMKFFAVSLLGLLINNLVIFSFVQLVETHITVAGYHVTNFWLGKLVATAVVMMWNFLVNNYFTFRKS